MYISEPIRRALSTAQRINLLTGAGVSTASGIPDFRSTDAAWTYHVPRDKAISLPYFLSEPDAFWDIYRAIFHTKMAAEPNDVHHWIADLQQGRSWARVTTQNVDGLHKTAGSRVALEIHGNVNSAICLNASCRARYDESFAEGKGAPVCEYCGQALKPDVVLFGESIKHGQAAINNAELAQVLLVMGTSLRVAPLNSIPRAAAWMNPGQIQIYVGNEEPPAGHNFAHVAIGDLRDFINEIPASLG